MGLGKAQAPSTPTICSWIYKRKPSYTVPSKYTARPNLEQSQPQREAGTLKGSGESPGAWLWNQGGHVCRRLALPWEQHKVEAVSPVPLCLVQLRPLLHQVFQVSRVQLETSDQRVHVRLIFLVMEKAAGGNRQRALRYDAEGARGVLTVSRVLEIMLTLCEGMGAGGSKMPRH